MSRTFTFLGTGTSTGIPMIGCECATCTSSDSRNHRYRCSVLIRAPGGRILIDTGPELRLQLLRARVPFAHAVLYTHYHADHVHGLDDVRLFPKKLGTAVPLYCTEETEAHIRRGFAYAFADGVEHLPPGVVPQLRFVRIQPLEPFEACGERILPIPLEHAYFNVLGFRIGNVAYCTDVSRIPDRSRALLEGLDVLVLDALRFKPHPAHFSLEEALAEVTRLQPRRALFTHMSHELEHVATNALLPQGVELAYDGLEFEF
jgi:phosphoribosyl 1,2-cyclic phosphate phosphodiesterase